jgi:hypothetical protein
LEMPIEVASVSVKKLFILFIVLIIRIVYIKWGWQ